MQQTECEVTFVQVADLVLGLDGAFGFEVEELRGALELEAVPLLLLGGGSATAFDSLLLDSLQRLLLNLSRNSKKRLESRCNFV